MKVTLDAFVLAAGGDESPVGLRLNGKRQVQAGQFLRAVAAIPFPRGNRVRTITFSVTREHASYAAAEAFLFTHGETLPASGVLKFITELFEGSVLQYAAAASAVESDDGSLLGVTTTHQYTLVCGPFTGANIPTGTVAS